MDESPGKMYALAIVLTLLAVLAVALRFRARHIKRAGLASDDYMIIPALVNPASPRYCRRTTISTVIDSLRSFLQSEQRFVCWSVSVFFCYLLSNASLIEY